MNPEYLLTICFRLMTYALQLNNHHPTSKWKVAQITAGILDSWQQNRKNAYKNNNGWNYRKNSYTGTFIFVSQMTDNHRLTWLLLI